MTDEKTLSTTKQTRKRPPQQPGSTSRSSHSPSAHSAQPPSRHPETPRHVDFLDHVRRNVIERLYWLHLDEDPAIRAQIPQANYRLAKADRLCRDHFRAIQTVWHPL